MEWSMIFELIDPRLFLVVAACWVIGYMLKKTPKVPDWSIVYIVVVFAVVFAVGLIGWSMEAIIQGILTGAFAVFGHQAVKQAIKGAGDK
ncbi:Phage holin family Hol44, holin superfamily V [Paenibacillus uliginis N3/975]|uniref:Phage holin family Hol44, holin superfamily V n=1 Tax=Paenibacillus uliginis N3/975 TaxID=1313296 RepID=A0A1X7HQK8_9BACL|nr:MULTISPECIES: phage holin family protein [Paenibacillus]UNK19068.1 phage holin family protein [Paenibacillus sp. N3/727]SMF91187.1 Phage holin family Hol44, holin superfamily V [Paenibacillus uliginis N3/975]